MGHGAGCPGKGAMAKKPQETGHGPGNRARFWKKIQRAGCGASKVDLHACREIVFVSFVRASGRREPAWGCERAMLLPWRVLEGPDVGRCGVAWRWDPVPPWEGVVCDFVSELARFCALVGCPRGYPACSGMSWGGWVQPFLTHVGRLVPKNTGGRPLLLFAAGHSAVLTAIVPSPPPISLSAFRLLFTLE